jgi:hypothetical protein
VVTIDPARSENGIAEHQPGCPVAASENEQLTDESLAMNVFCAFEMPF